MFYSPPLHEVAIVILRHDHVIGIESPCSILWHRKPVQHHTGKAGLGTFTLMRDQFLLGMAAQNSNQGGCCLRSRAQSLKIGPPVKGMHNMGGDCQPADLAAVKATLQDMPPPP